MNNTKKADISSSATNYEVITHMSPEELASAIDNYETWLAGICNPEYCSLCSSDGKCLFSMKEASEAADMVAICHNATLNWLNAKAGGTSV